MDEINVLKIKKLRQDAILPFRAHDNDAGWDLTAIENVTPSEKGYFEYRTGLAIQLPTGYDALIFPRSSISNYDLVLANGIGLVDEGYRGELLIRFKPCLRSAGSPFNSVHDLRIYKKGDRIAQLVLRKRPLFIIQEVDSLSDSERSSGGFGSTNIGG